MENKTLSVALRTEFGKGPSRRSRSEGKIPAVIYGVHENKSITVDKREFSKKFKRISANTIISLDFGKEKYDVLIKDYQANIIKETIDHIDFLEIEKGKLLKTYVPVVLSGNAPGVKEGGILVQKVSEVEVECLPKDIPEQILVDIDNLEIGHSIHVGEISDIKGVTVLLNTEITVAVVNHPKSEEVAASDDEGMEEEVEEEETAKEEE